MTGAVEPLHIPEGRLVRSRVVPGVSHLLDAALDEALTGYAVVEPQSGLLLDEPATTVLTFEAGVPVLAYHLGRDAGGSAALAELGGLGPVHVECYELPAAALREAHETNALRVAPGLPAERLAGDPALADRTRAAAPDRDRSPDGDAVAAFLEDEERIDAIRAAAREEAERRAADWGLDDQLAGQQQNMNG